MSDITFGLHIGDSSLCIAFCKDGKSEVVANNAGERITPAIFCYQDQEKIVGLSVKQANAGNTVIRNKSALLNIDTKIESKTRRIEATSLQNDKTYQLENGIVIQPIEILIYFYKKLYETASNQVGKSEDKLNSVLTVPYGCDEEVVDEMVKSAEIAGFNIVRVISEPSAAALAYGIGQENCQDTSTIVLFRLGGYSCDCTVMDIVGGMYTVLSHVSRHDIGGEDFTQTLVDYFANDFKSKWGSDPRLGRRSLLKLCHASQTCKQVLSTMSTASAFIESLSEGIDYNGTVSRARYESMISSIISESTSIIEKALEEAKVNKDNINKVIVCGGSSKIPRVQSAVSSVLPKAELLCFINPDEAIALGAAEQAGIVGSNTDRKPATDINTITQHIFLQVNEGERLLVLPSGTPVPSRRTTCLSVTSSKAVVELLQGATAEEAVALAQVGLETDESLEVTATLNLSSDGSLHMTASSGKNCVSLTIEGPEE